MGKQAKGTLTFSDWQEAPYVEWDGGAKLVQAKITGRFGGDLDGDASSTLLMAYRDEAHASFTGLQVLDGSLDGRTGRFVLQLSGTFDTGTATVTWSVVPGSATGELAGLTGTGGYTAGPGDFPGVAVSLDYEL